VSIVTGTQNDVTRAVSMLDHRHSWNGGKGNTLYAWPLSGEPHDYSAVRQTVLSARPAPSVSEEAPNSKPSANDQKWNSPKSKEPLSFAQCPVLPDKREARPEDGERDRPSVSATNAKALTGLTHPKQLFTWFKDVLEHRLF